MKDLIRKILLSELDIPNPVHGASGSQSVSSGYGNRTHPTTGEQKMHYGIDIAVGCGTPLIAPADGTVKEVGFKNDACGGRIKIDHGTYSTRYCHLQKIDVGPNEQIFRGELIGETGGEPGTVGAGTSTSGCHLHMEVQRPIGKTIDPTNIVNLGLSPKRTRTEKEYGINTKHLSIKYLKCFLKNTKYGPDLNLDDSDEETFDKKTEDALKELQKDLGIPETGKIDNTIIPLIKDKIQELSLAQRTLIKNCIDS